MHNLDGFVPTINNSFSIGHNEVGFSFETWHIENVFTLEGFSNSSFGPHSQVFTLATIH